MATDRQQRKDPVRASPSSALDTVVRFLTRTTGDSGRTLRFIAIVSCLVFAAVFAITAAVCWIIIATEGIHKVKPSYLLPTGVFGGGSLLVWITITIRDFVMKRRRRRTNGKEPPGTS
jgi:hypothetical protein